MRFDIVVHNGTILTVNHCFEIIEQGVLGISRQRIAYLGRRSDSPSLPDARQVIDANGGIVMPGLVNAHTHLPMSLFRGLADDLPLMVWLNEHIFPAEGRYLNPHTVRLGTLLSCAEMLLSGTTTCCDGYFHEDCVAGAVKEIGLRGVLAQGVIDYPAPGVSDPSQNIAHTEEFIHKWLEATDTVRPSVFCHSAYTCSPDTLVKAKALAAKHGLLFQIHTAETRKESELIGLQPDQSPVQYLDQLGLIDQQTLLVHCVWTNARDIDIIAQRKAGIAHNPASNMKLASGSAPVHEFMAANINVGLGTDGAASNNNLDLFQEMGTAAKLHKLQTLDPTVLDAATAIKMATIQSAQAIGLGDHIGSLEVGKQADLIILDTYQPHLMPMHNPVSHIVYAANGHDVRDVIVNGSVLIADRKFLNFDLEGILDAAMAFKQGM